MRGKKLMAWEIPAIWKDLEENALQIPEGSSVSQKQKVLLKTIRQVLAAVSKDMSEGFLETVGVESTFSMDGGRCSMILKLPKEADVEKIAQAIDLENIEAWCDDEGRVHVAVSPWYSTKDVDQAVLSAVKVVHVLLGLHAANANQSKTIREKILGSIAEIIKIQKSVKK